MKDTLKAYTLSLLIHSLFFLFLLLLNQGLRTSQKELIEIDLSFENFEVSQSKERPMEVQEEKAKGSERITAKKPQLQEVFETKQQLEKEQTVEEYKETALAQTVEEVREEPSSEGFTQAQTVEKVQEGSSKEGFTQAKGPSLDEDKGTALAQTVEKVQRESSEVFLKEKFLVISSLVQKRISYPLIARRMGWEGKVLVSFVLEPSGEIRDLRVLKSCGTEVLDREALEGVKRSYRDFPKPPVEVLIKLPVVFKLE